MPENETPLENIADDVALVDDVADAEEPTETEADVAAGSEGFEVDIETFPELQGKSIGEPITLAIRDISEDGSKYTLVIAGDEQASQEGLPQPASPDEGRRAVEEALAPLSE